MVNTTISRIFKAALAGMMLLAAQSALAAWPESPHIEAKSWAMIDARSGQVVAAHNENEELPMASLTKMMTLYIAFEDIKLGRLDPNTKIDVSKKAWKIGGSTMFLEPRLHPTIDQILHGIATLSGNDACIALAEHLDGSEDAFAQRMNRKAAELGMTHTHFVNATGFPAEGHHSTALDMAKIGAALWRDHPEMYKLFGEHEYAYEGHTQPNRNRILWSMPEADGIKTGHTQAAGYCLVGSAEQSNTRFVAAVFGTSSDRARAQQTQALLKFGFRNFVSVRPTEREIRRQVEVWEGTENSVWLKPADAIWVTVPKGAESELNFRLRYDAPLKAPISEGDKLGTITATFGKDKASAQELKTVDMIAVRAVERASWISRQIDTLQLWWRDDSGMSGEKESTEAAAH